MLFFNKTHIMLIVNSVYETYLPVALLFANANPFNAVGIIVPTL